jgi:hypothetical protein
MRLRFVVIAGKGFFGTERQGVREPSREDRSVVEVIAN